LGLPVRRSKRIVARALDVQVSLSNSPSAAVPSSCEQRSSMAKKSPPQLNHADLIVLHSMSLALAGGSSEMVQTSMTSAKR